MKNTSEKTIKWSDLTPNDLFGLEMEGLNAELDGDAKVVRISR
jgi:hypothetical protein